MSIREPRTGRAHRELADPDSRFARLAGIDVHHKVAGEGSPPVVLLHHFYGNVFTWRHVMDRLSQDTLVTAFDRPAFGLTERPARDDWMDGNPYTRATSATITVELMDHLGLESAVLVGSSAGGTAALEVFARHPERVSGLVLVSPAITGDVGAPPPWRDSLRSSRLRRLAPLVIQRFAAVDLDRVTRSWADPTRGSEEDVDAYARPFDAPRWAEALFEVFVSEPPPDLRDVLPTIDVPTVVVGGDHDRVIRPAWNRRTAAAIPTGRYVELEHCGHTPQEEQPDALVAVIRELLAEVA